MAIENNADAVRAPHVAEHWYSLEGDEPIGRVYRPAVLIDCRVNFRSLKAGLNHSEERSYTAWLPAGSVAVDWDAKALAEVAASRLAHAPETGVEQPDEQPDLGVERWEEIETDLVEALARREKLVVSYNPLFDLFSGVDESLDDFLDRVAEAALQRIEPELKQLKAAFELQLEQVREAQINKRGAAIVDAAAAGSAGGKAEVERLLRRRTEFFETENRITSLFTGLAGFVLETPFVASGADEEDENDAAFEIREDLARVEKEAADALDDLYARYLEMVRSYDEFEVRIQPSNIRVLRRALLWVPVEKSN
jgi:hypothetical protein